MAMEGEVLRLQPTRLQQPSESGQILHDQYLEQQMLQEQQRLHGQHQEQQVSQQQRHWQQQHHQQPGGQQQQHQQVNQQTIQDHQQEGMSMSAFHYDWFGLSACLLARMWRMMLRQRLSAFVKGWLCPLVYIFVRLMLDCQTHSLTRRGCVPVCFILLASLCLRLCRRSWTARVCISSNRSTLCASFVSVGL